MALKLNKNDYQIYTDLQRFANTTRLGKVLKPLLRGFYQRLKLYLPYPRDSFLRRLPKGGVGIEVGVYEGVFSERIIRFVRPKKLYLVDPWTAELDTGSKKDPQENHDRRYRAVLTKFANQIDNGSVVVTRTTSDDVWATFPDTYFDFVYIDGDHSYEQVTKDLEHFLPKTKVIGVLTGDDYHYDSVKRAVDEFAQKNALNLKVHEQQFLLKRLVQK